MTALHFLLSCKQEIGRVHLKGWALLDRDMHHDNKGSWTSNNGHGALLFNRRPLKVIDIAGLSHLCSYMPACYIWLSICWPSFQYPELWRISSAASSYSTLSASLAWSLAQSTYSPVQCLTGSYLRIKVHYVSVTLWHTALEITKRQDVWQNLERKISDFIQVLILLHLWHCSALHVNILKVCSHSWCLKNLKNRISKMLASCNGMVQKCR